MAKPNLDRPLRPVRCETCGFTLASYQGASLLFSPGLGTGLRPPRPVLARCPDCRRWRPIPARAAVTVAPAAAVRGDRVDRSPHGRRSAPWTKERTHAMRSQE